MTHVTTSRRIAVDPACEIDAHIALPDAAEGRPAVIVLGEIWGVNANIRAICGRLADAGVAAVAPDQYRGQKPPVESDPRETVLGFFERFDDPGGIRDSRAVLDWLLRGGLGVRPGPVRVLGFCLGGRFAHYLAAFDPRLSGAVNFYGRLRFPRQPELKPFTPLDVAGLVACPYLGLFGAIDEFIPAGDVEALGREFTRRRTPHHLNIYQGAHHAFFNDTRASYDESAARDAWAKALAFLREGHLP